MNCKQAKMLEIIKRNAIQNGGGDLKSESVETMPTGIVLVQIVVGRPNDDGKVTEIFRKTTTAIIGLRGGVKCVS